jgi:hypothetical protein
MSVSTKTPVSRAAGGAPEPPPRPIPAPRVVGNRRIRAGGIALAIMLLALGAALSGLALVSASRTTSYLVVARPVSENAQIQDADLSTVELSGGKGLGAIAASYRKSVVGRYATVELMPGMLAIQAEFSATPPLGLNQQNMAVPVAAKSMPAGIKPGDKITIYANSATDTSASWADIVIVNVARSGGGDGSAVLTVAVPPSEAQALSLALASNGVTIAWQKTGG